MTERHKKFLNLEEAAAEIVKDLSSSEPEQIKLFADIYVLLVGGKAGPGKHKESSDFIEQFGIWYQADKDQKKVFYNWHRFRELLAGEFLKAKPDTTDIAKIYSRVMWVNSYSGTNEHGEDGIWVETEMEKFKCVQCGNCCDWVSFLLEDDRTLADLWISPRTGEEVTRCPWLRKLPKKDKYKCRIHETKPAHCKNYPKSKKHALTTGCKGF